MASNIKVDIVKPTATNGSLSLKGDSGGSATANGITVDSSGNTSITGTFTSKGIDDNASTTALTIDASGKAGIGTISPATQLTVYRKDSGTSNGALRLDGNGNYAGVQFAASGALHGSLGGDNSALYLTHNTALAFKTGAVGNVAGTERMRIDTSGHVIVPNGVTLGTAAGTYAAAKTLDDYEEGTFTLTGKDSGGSTQFTATNQVYQKIGNRCFVEILFTNSTATNAVKLDGLPFVASGQSWAPNSQFFDRYTTVNNGTSYVTWATSSNATHTIRMQFSYQTV